jgi:nicotinate-nucleotide--dimethylbenzimidazole phosphoribosyltransferase
VNIDWLNKEIPVINIAWEKKATQRQYNLTKPPGSLGRLEQIAIKLSAMQGCEMPSLERIQIVVFAADHGVAEEGVSAFPQSVTVEMVKNFAGGGAAISVLAKELGADLEVVNVGTVTEHEKLPAVMLQRIAAGTANFVNQQAMTQAQLSAALNAGRDAVDRGKQKHMQLFIGGDMGIANTSSATAVACALLNEKPEILAGPGTGLSNEGVRHKADIIDQGLKLHASKLNSAEDALQCLGGFEIAALTGAYIYCAQQSIPVLVDGFISSIAALAALKINADVNRWMFFSHASAEPGQQIIMQAINEKPLLDLGMRLGEGSGAAVAVAVLRMACVLHNNMATFEQAGVSNKNQ